MPFADVYYLMPNTMLKNSYFKLMAVKAAIVEYIKTLSQYLSPFAQ